MLIIGTVIKTAIIFGIGIVYWYWIRIGNHELIQYGISRMHIRAHCQIQMFDNRPEFNQTSLTMLTTYISFNALHLLIFSCLIRITLHTQVGRASLILLLSIDFRLSVAGGIFENAKNLAIMQNMQA